MIQAATKGMVLNIEKFATHDGPGIRTAVFLKGCPLQCRWCTAPDSQRAVREMEYFAQRCTACGKCIELCPTKAVSRSANEIVTDRDLCDNCGNCAELCPNGARKIAGEEMTVEKVLEEVEQDSIFYQNSGGGVTLSGGEPTMQPGFALAILKGCVERGIHTAIETCGYVKWEVFDELLKYIDLVFMDIKYLEQGGHERLTGKSNTLILENARKIVMNYPEKPLIIRIPVIPGCNDSEENIRNIARFVHELDQMDGRHRIELLAYHKLGMPKYTALSIPYPLPGLETPSEERMQALAKIVESCGVEVQVGG